MNSYITKRELKEKRTGYEINICKMVDKHFYKSVNETYVDALRLAYPEKKRVSAVSGNVKRNDQPPVNNQLTLFNGGRLK